MTRSTWLAAALVLVSCTSVPPTPSAPDGEMPLLESPGLGGMTHPITTKSEIAQAYFDQGLMLTFGFNHADAVRSFEVALANDAECAMCWWGIAYALGPNINLPMGEEAEKEAHAAIQKAIALKDKVSAAERDYIDTLATRYSIAPDHQRRLLDLVYADEAKKLMEKYPDDLDAANFYAEALMDLNPWNHWDKAGNAVAETPEIVAVLESVLARKPDHTGANHLYIHAVEASMNPDRAESAADRLAGLAPTSGHLVHMPSHIYWRVGRYADARKINQRAAQADEAYFAWCRTQGIYPALYYPHNIHFIWSVANVEGNRGIAITEARRLASKIPDEMLVDFPAAQDFRAVVETTMARFGLWDEILANPAPPAEHVYHTLLWHYTRGLAYTRKGDPAKAELELARVRELAGSEGIAALFIQNQQGSALANLALEHLEGEVLAAAGEYDRAVPKLEAAVARQDSFTYIEPPAFYFPVRQALGAVLLDAGAAKQAEAVFRADLKKNKANGWSLFGLAKSLRDQSRVEEAAIVDRGFAEAWANADVEITESRF